MKTITNKKVSWKWKGEDFDTDTFGMLRTALENIPAEGLKISQMRDRLNLLDKLNEAKDDQIKFENAEFKLLFSMMQAQSWVVITQEIADFYAELEKINDK